MTTASTIRLSANALRDFAQRAGEHAGIPARDLALFVDSLVEADLRGIDTHGVVRIPAYVNGMLQGLVNPRPQLRETRRRGAVVTIDGDNGLGGIIGQRAMDLAIKIAQEQGIGVVSMRNSNHAGMLAVHVQRAIDRGCVGYFVSNGPAVMAPWGGRVSLISNNPMAYGFPAGSAPPIVFDMACSAVARGKLRQAAQHNMPIPEGWAVDEHDHPTKDPHAAMRGRVLPMAGHKGYGLAVVNEILSAVLPAARLSFEVSTAFLQEGARALDSWEVGHFVLALDIEAFLDRADYAARVDSLVGRLKSSAVSDGFSEILMPGEPEWRQRRDRLANGVPVSETTRDLLNAAAQSWGIPGLEA